MVGEVLGWTIFLCNCYNYVLIMVFFNACKNLKKKNRIFLVLRRNTRRGKKWGKLVDIRDAQYIGYPSILEIYFKFGNIAFSTAGYYWMYNIRYLITYLCFPYFKINFTFKMTYLLS